MGSHSRLAASDANRWWNCPGSLRLSEGIPRTRSTAASLGTAVHAIGEHVLQGRKPPKIGSEFKFLDGSEKSTIIVDEEMLESIQVHIDNIAVHKLNYKKAIVYLEESVNLNHIRHGIGGTADTIIDTKRDVLITIDYKNGFIPVHLIDPEYRHKAKEKDGHLRPANILHVNKQLLIYAAGAAHKNKWRYPLTQLEIVQPRSQEVPNIQSVQVLTKDLQHWAENDLFEAACNTEMADAPLIPGEWCRWCPVITTCPAVMQKTQEDAGIDFRELEPSLPAVTEYNLGTLLKWIPILDQLGKTATTMATEMLTRDPNSVPGWKLVRKRSRRKWPTDDPQKLRRLLNKAGASVSLEDITDVGLKSPKQLEELVDVDVVNEVAIKPEGGLTLGADSDYRPAITAGSDFEELI